MAILKHARRPRQSDRTKVFMRGVLVTAGGAQAVTIRDISRHGAKVFGRDHIPDTCDVMFRLKGIFAAARIAWSKDRQAGLNFYRELTPNELGATLPPPLPFPG